MTKLCEETCGSVQMLQSNFEPGRGYSPDFSNYDAYLNDIAAFVAPLPVFHGCAGCRAPVAICLKADELSFFLAGIQLG